MADDVLAAIDPTLAAPRSVRATGVPPRAVLADRGLPDAVAAVVADEAAGLGDRDADDVGEVPAGRVAVLAPVARVADLRARVLPDAGGTTEPDLDAPVVVLPVSAAKGLEFDAVVLVEPAELVAESPRGLNDLYVALTRATQRLTVVHRAPLPPVLHRLGE